MREQFRLGGRTFVPLARPTTLLHDGWMVDQIRLAGLMPAVLEENEDKEAFAIRVVSGLLANGQAYELVAGLIVPKGTRSTGWTPRLAGEMATLLAGVSEEREKALVTQILIEGIVDFFERGPAYCVITTTSSRETRPAAAPLNPDAGMGSGAPSSLH